MNADQASQLRKQASQLIAEQRRLERVLLGHGSLLRGSLLERPKFCGKKGCKCTRGQPHPPSLYLSCLQDGTARHLFIRAADHHRAKREAGAYKEFRSALRRWRAIEKELNQIWEGLGALREEDYPFG
jgi:plasmid stability protein